MKIAIIGAGNMGGSIARGLAKGSLIEDSDIIVSNPSAGKLEQLKKEFPNISTTHNNAEAANGSGHRYPRRKALVYAAGNARVEAEGQADTYIRSRRNQF